MLRILRFPGYFETPLFRTFFHFPWDFEIAGFDCICFFSENYRDYFTTPYFIFIRDTLSYLALLGLHFAVCLSPSSIEMTGLEWAIMVFFMGRTLLEIQQLRAVYIDMKRYKQRELKMGQRLKESFKVYTR